MTLAVDRAVKPQHKQTKFVSDRTPKTHQTTQHVLFYQANFQSQIETLDFKKSRYLPDKRINEEYLFALSCSIYLNITEYIYFTLLSQLFSVSLSEVFWWKVEINLLHLITVRVYLHVHEI